MSIATILWRNIKWRFNNVFTIVITILQPMLWLVLYSAVAGQSMQGMGVENYTAFILPGLIVLVSFSACSSSGIMNYMMKTSGSFYRVLIAPINRSSIVLGQMLEAVLCTFVEVVVMCTISLFFSVKIASGLTGVMLIASIVFMTAFFISGLTYTISLCLPNEVVYETAMNAIVLPIFFLSSALFPSENLSGILAAAVGCNPFTHVINALRSLIFSEAVLFESVLPVILFLMIMCYGSFALALWKLKKEMTD
jgi:ABC-2 type transport system permease protein